MDSLHIAITVSAAVGLLGLLGTFAKMLMMGGKLVDAVEKFPHEVTRIRDELREEIGGIRTEVRDGVGGIRAELKQSGDSTLGVLQKHGEDIAVIRDRLRMDDGPQPKRTPHIKLRGAGL